MFREKMLPVAILFWSLAVSELHANALQIQQSVGTKSYFAMDSIQKIIFSNGHMIVEDKGNRTDTFSISPTLQISFIDSIPDSSGIAHTTAILSFSHQSQNILDIAFTGNQNENRSVEIFSVDGALLQATKVTKSNMVSIDLNKQSPGIYVCKITNGLQVQSVSFLKK